MPDIRQPSANRRQFLRTAALGTGLVLQFTLLPPGARGALAAAAAGGLQPNAFVRVAPDDTVTVAISHVEMGQGVHTGLAAIAAEELDADWSRVRVEAAAAMKLTGGSNSVAGSWTELRQAGATARAMLVAAAAQAWSVPAAEITTAAGVLRHPGSGRQARYGAMAERAGTLPVPENVPLKDPSAFRLIGRDLPRLDNDAKTSGTAQFALDVSLPGTVTALVARPPRFGAKVKSIDDKAARAVPGVVAVVQIPRGVAVVANGYWAAHKGREALQVAWDDSGAETRSTADLLTEYRRIAATGTGTVARNDGDAAGALAKKGARTFTAEYVFPYLAHAPMEPLNCVVRLTRDACEIWTGCQAPPFDYANAAAAAGLKPEQVKINVVLAGGSFGRRANPESDYIAEAVSVAKAWGGDAPVKLVWTREDDIRGGRYRPFYVHSLSAAVDKAGKPVGWKHHIVGQSIFDSVPMFRGMMKDGIDPTSTEGAVNIPYAIPNFRLEVTNTATGVPILWWRSVGSTHTAFATETFIDELAQAAGQDPLAYRRALMAGHPRHLKVLDLVAEKAGWGAKLPAGKARGIAVAESFGTVVAQVAEVGRDAEGKIKVERVVCAVDCGTAVTPDVIRAQMEGGIGFGLGAVLFGAVTLDKGEVEQSNFHDYRVLRIAEMPAVEVHIVPSANPPTGVGEPGVPPIGPAVANAVAALTGQRVRALPMVSAVSV